MLTAERLKELLDYNPYNGELIYRRSRGSRRARRAAGTVKYNQKGLIIIKIDRECYTAQHLVWLYVTGEHPRGYIRHKNGLRWDNR
jgi:hypothetical protein